MADINPGESLDLEGADDVTLTHDGPKPADVEISGDMQANVRIEPGASKTIELHRNSVTITNKSKYVVTADW